MKKFQPYKKGTVLALTGGVDHLHVICNDPVYYPIDGCECVLAVNISSVKPGVPFDQTCVLKAGEHPFVRHDSFVVYAQAVVWKVSSIERNVSNKSITPQPHDMPEKVFSRILQGFDISDEVQPRHRKFWKTHCTIDDNPTQTT